MKAFRVVVTMLSGGILSALNFALYLLILVYLSARVDGAMLDEGWVTNVTAMGGVFGFLYGLMFGLFVGLFIHDLGSGTAFGAVTTIVWLSIFGPALHTDLPAPVAPVVLVFFIWTSTFVGFLTVRTAAELTACLSRRLHGFARPSV